MAGMSKDVLFRYEVSYAGYPVVQVNARDRQEATVKAANIWNVSWREIAGDCDVTFVGTAAKPRCGRCHNEFGEAGDIKAYCPRCLEEMDRERRERARFAPSRRKPGYIE